MSTLRLHVDAGWREGARSRCPDDVCPACHTPACVFASDFKAMGKKSVRACDRCGSVSVNGKLEGKLVCWPDAPAPTTTTTTATG